MGGPDGSPGTELGIGGGKAAVSFAVLAGRVCVMRGMPSEGSDVGSKPEPTQGESSALRHCKLRFQLVSRFWHLKEGRHCR